jgi:hypothetical protein
MNSVLDSIFEIWVTGSMGVDVIEEKVKVFRIGFLILIWIWEFQD